MPGVVRLGDYCSGHGGFRPRPGIEASNNVFVNSRRAHHKNDRWDTHCNTYGCHEGQLIQGSSTVFINSLATGRNGDRIDCGSLASNGSGNVFVDK